MWSQTCFIEENKMDSGNSRISFFRWQKNYFGDSTLFFIAFFFFLNLGVFLSLFTRTRGWQRLPEAETAVVESWEQREENWPTSWIVPVSLWAPSVRVLVSLGLISFIAVCHLQYVHTENPGHVFTIFIENVPFGEFLDMAISKILSSKCMSLTY